MGLLGPSKKVVGLEQEIASLRQQVADLQQFVDATGGGQAVAVKRALDHVKANHDSFVEWANREHEKIQNDLRAEAHRVEKLRAEAIDLREMIHLQDFGLYNYEHPAENSIALGARLEDVRREMKAMISRKEAVSASTNFTFNNSTRQGKKFTSDMSKLMLRSYNNEAENAVKSVKTGNVSPALKRVERALEQAEKLGSMIDLRLNRDYHRLRLEEVDLAARHHAAVKAEKEAERERRAELREQAKAEQELEKERERLRKEREHYNSVLARLEELGDEEGARRAREQIAEIEKGIADVDYRVANARAGYVYVISNIGAFGPQMVKIGMTRRLEPMDRVRELGDASVPFGFDVHALFFSKDAVAVENQLHRRFAHARVNRVNLRREFFRVTPGEVREALREITGDLLEFREEAEAEQFRTSLAMAQGSGTGPQA